MNSQNKGEVFLVIGVPHYAGKPIVNVWMLLEEIIYKFPYVQNNIAGL